MIGMDGNRGSAGNGEWEKSEIEVGYKIVRDD